MTQDTDVIFHVLGKDNISQKAVSPSKLPIISHETILIFTWLVYGTLCQLIVIFGIVTNVINIICFAKQGFKESINVSLLGLSISDLGCLTTLLVTNVCFTLGFSGVDLTFDPIEVNYLITAMPHLTFSRVTSWITALITLERCLCVAAPLKIKELITPKRASFAIACVFVILFSMSSPIYTVNKLGLKFSPFRNRTIFGLIYTEDRDNVEKITFIINNFCLSFAAFFINIAATLTLVIKLKNSEEWRATSSNKHASDRVSNRNQKVAKMVVMISTLFIICFVPLSITMLALAFEPELSFNGKYIYVMVMLGGLGFLLESINSSVNIFIYYQMSTKYRDTFRKLACINWT